MANKKKFFTNKKIIIFTCGYYGRLTFRKLYKKNKILNFFDNYSKRKKLFNVNIIKPKFIKSCHFDYICLAGRDIFTLKNQLFTLGFKKRQIKIFNNIEIKPSNQESFKREKLSYALLAKILDLFKLLKINYVCSYSGLLSVIREKNLSSFSDFEISLQLKYNKKLLRYLKKNKFALKYNKSFIHKKNIYKSYYVVSKKNFNKIIEYPRISFVFLHNHLGGYREIAGKKIYKKHYFTHIKKMDVHNLELNVPYNYKEHLMDWYGKKWEEKSKFWVK